MDTRKEVALFVDFENIREGVRNSYGVEIDPQLLIAKARKYGLVNIARAYADFDRVPTEIQRSMEVCGLTAINAPSHLVGDRRRSAADLDLLMDLIETMLDRSGIPTILLMSGDRDFLRVVTMARNRFAKEVIVSGVPGTVSADLIEAAGSNFDPLEVPGVERHTVRPAAAIENGAVDAPPREPAASETAAAKTVESAAPRGGARRATTEYRDNRDARGRERDRDRDREGGRGRYERTRRSASGEAAAGAPHPAYGRRPTRQQRPYPEPSQRARLPQPDVAEELGQEDEETREQPVPSWQRGKLAARAEAIQQRIDERRASGEDVQGPWDDKPAFAIGDDVEGVVKSITDFGAFLDVGGVDALLHVSQMAWQHVRHPSQIVSVGESLRVRVMELDEESGRVSVGLKQLSPDPWLTAGDKYDVGRKVAGRVSGVKEYGVFVELEPGIFGLLHISNIFEQPWGHHPSEKYKLDQDIEVTVSKIDPEMRRLAFVLPGTPIPVEEKPEEVVAGLPRVTEDEEEAAEAAFRFREGEDE